MTNQRSGFLGIPWISTIIAGCIAVSVFGCIDLSKISNPSESFDPKAFYTEDGVVAMYQSVVAQFEGGRFSTLNSDGTFGTPSNQPGAFLNTVLIGGLLSDELQPSEFGGTLQLSLGVSSYIFSIDARRLPELGAAEQGAENNLSKELFVLLNGVRVQASHAIQALRTYGHESPPAFRGHLYALAGYSEIFLADIYCSGVPLSTLEFEGNYRYQPGRTTRELYEHASSLFDSALTLSTDSSRILNLARIGKARALLNLEKYEEAIAVAQNVPDDYLYKVFVNWKGTGTGSRFEDSKVTIADKDGGIGFPYVKGNDPRTVSDSGGVNQFGVPWFFPRKAGAKVGNGYLIVADAHEVRLLRAEAALRQNRVSDWLDELNQLRVKENNPLLPQLEDPQIPDERVDLLFRERAAWLFFSGQRQGDLRRLIRQYKRETAKVYPSSLYPAPSVFTTYGEDVTLPIPYAERVNPYFTGCKSREA